MPPDANLLELFLQLIRIDGVSDNERAPADYIKSYLSSLGFTPHEDDTARRSGGNTGNVICKIGSGGNFVLLSHLDTVSSTANTVPIILADRITSSGDTILGADNRAGISALLYALARLRRENRKINDFTLAFTVCEESEMWGSASIQLPPQIKMGIVFDSHNSPGNYIYRGYGAKSFEINITGKASHAGLAPEKGVNAIAIAGCALSQIRQGRLDDETTANIGVIRGGSAPNVVPSSVFLEGEVRSLDPGKIDNYINETDNIFRLSAKKYDGRTDFKSKWAFKPYEIPSHSLLRAKIEAALKSAGLKPTPVISAGGSDANNLNAKGIDTINIGIGAQNPHSFDEFILLEDLQKTAEIAVNLMEYKE